MNQEIILVNLPPAANYSYENPGLIYPATGIMLVATILKNIGLKVRVVDGVVKSDYKKITLDLINNRTMMVGFSAMTNQVPMALELSKLIKERDQRIPVVWGGIHSILFPEQTVANPNIDIVVTGEGAKTVLELVKYLKKDIAADEVRGIGFKDASGKAIFTRQADPDDLDAIPHFDYTVLDDAGVYLNSQSVYQREILTDNKEGLKIMPILTALGCCYHCQFCINTFLKRKYRFRSALSIISEVKNLQNKYGANAFIFYDEDFFISKPRALEFLDFVEKEKLKFYWRTWCRVDYFKENYLNRELVCRLEKNGLRSLAMGAESGSQKVLDIIQKGIRVENIISSAEILKGTRINARYSFIAGLDGEEKEDTRKTYKVCADLMEINPRVDIAGPFIFRHYPGSPIFNRLVKKYDIEIADKLEDWKALLSSEGYLRVERMPWTWPGFFETITVLNKGINLFVRLRDVNNPICKVIKGIIKWRTKTFCIKFPFELYVYNLLNKLRRTYINFQMTLGNCFIRK